MRVQTPRLGRTLMASNRPSPFKPSGHSPLSLALRISQNGTAQRGARFREPRSSSMLAWSLEISASTAGENTASAGGNGRDSSHVKAGNGSIVHARVRFSCVIIRRASGRRRSFENLRIWLYVDRCGDAKLCLGRLGRFFSKPWRMLNAYKWIKQIINSCPIGGHVRHTVP